MQLLRIKSTSQAVLVRDLYFKEESRARYVSLAGLVEKTSTDILFVNRCLSEGR